MDSIDPNMFKNMTSQQLQEIEDRLIRLKKERNETYIKPQIKQHIKPLRDKYIKPLQKEHIKPIDHALKEVRKYLPKTKEKFWRIGNTKYGPMSKKELYGLIQECDP